MTWSYRARILAAAIAVGSVSTVAMPLAAQAQVSVSIGFDTFHDRLRDYGDWVYSDRWGEVWIPGRVAADFHPYQSDGYWAYTGEYGWTWVSNTEWGDIPFHYGRWVNDPDDGWLWIPGYVWSPGWVIWRSNGQYTGWMPMPPDEGFLRGGGGTSVSIGFGGFSLNFDDTSSYYGYSRWYGRGYDENRFASNWVFVDTRHMPDRDYRRYAANRGNVVNIIRNTKNVTNYTVVNNYYVNRSINVQQVERASGRRLAPVAARQVMRNPALVTQVSVGRQIQEQARAERPHGDGLANSAPKPAPEIVRTLSTRAIERNGRVPQHLYTQQTVAQAPLPPAPANPTPLNARRPAANAPPAQATPERTPQDRGRPTERGDRPIPNGAPPIRQPERPAPTAVGPPAPATPERAPQDRGRPAERGDRPVPNGAPPIQQPERPAPAAVTPPPTPERAPQDRARPAERGDRPVQNVAPPVQQPERPAPAAVTPPPTPERAPQDRARPAERGDRPVPNVTPPVQQPERPAPAAVTPPPTPERAPQDRARPAERGDRPVPNVASPTPPALPQRPAPAAVAPPAQPPAVREMPRPARPDAAPGPERDNPGKGNQERAGRAAPPVPAAAPADAPRDNRGKDDSKRDNQ